MVPRRRSPHPWTSAAPTRGRPAPRLPPRADEDREHRRASRSPPRSGLGEVRHGRGEHEDERPAATRRLRRASAARARAARARSGSAPAPRWGSPAQHAADEVEAVGHLGRRRRGRRRSGPRRLLPRRRASETRSAYAHRVGVIPGRAPSATRPPCRVRRIASSESPDSSRRRFVGISPPVATTGDQPGALRQRDLADLLPAQTSFSPTVISTISRFSLRSSTGGSTRARHLCSIRPMIAAVAETVGAIPSRSK